MLFNLDRRIYIIAGCFIILGIFWAGARYGEMRAENSAAPAENGILLEEAEPVQSKPPVSALPEEEQPIRVYVAGAVSQPDIYELNKGARVYEAVRKAGPQPGADLVSLSMARKLQDGETIYVCLPGEIPPEPVPSAVSELEPSAGSDSRNAMNYANASATGLLDINTASQQELDEVLPGIGPSLAGRIIDYRTNNGPFADIAELKEVSGIGDKKYDGIKDLITVN